MEVAEHILKQYHHVLQAVGVILALDVVLDHMRDIIVMVSLDMIVLLLIGAVDNFVVQQSLIVQHVVMYLLHQHAQVLALTQDNHALAATGLHSIVLYILEIFLEEYVQQQVYHTLTVQNAVIILHNHAHQMALMHHTATAVTMFKQFIPVLVLLLIVTYRYSISTQTSVANNLNII
jgi:hypothetical protein